MSSQRPQLLSASGLTRAIHCLPSHVYPAAAFTTIYGEHGQDLHDFIRQALTTGRDEALAEVPTDSPARGACESLDVDALPKGGHLEVAFAYNWRTGKARILGYNIGRRYLEHGLDPDTEIPGSADYAGAQPGVAVVVDYKSGWNLEPARNSWQGALLVLAAADVFECERGRFGHLILRDGQEPRWDIAELDELHLLHARSTIRQLVEALIELRREYAAGRELDVNQGAWCKYCLAFDRCPGKVGLARTMLPGLETVGKQLDAMSVGDLAQVVLKLELIDAIRNRVLEKIEERVARGEDVPLGDGRVYTMAAGRGQDAIVAPHKALRLVATMCDEKTAEAAMATGKGKIEEAVRDWAKANGHKIGATQKYVIDELREKGAIRKNPGEVKPRIVSLPANGGTR